MTYQRVPGETCSSQDSAETQALLEALRALCNVLPQIKTHRHELPALLRTMLAQRDVNATRLLH